MVVRGGVVSGTWEQDGATVRVAWFREAGAPPRTKLATEVKRLGRIADRAFRLEIEAG